MKRPSINRAELAWRAALLHEVGPKHYAELMNRIASHPGLRDRATRTEQRQPGGGLQVIAMALNRRESR